MGKKAKEQLNKNLKAPYMLVDLARSIYSSQEELATARYELVQKFIEKLKETNNENILDFYVDYIMIIIESDMIYEEMVKVHSLCEDCYILYQLGSRTDRELSSFYDSLEAVVSENSRVFKDIKDRFCSEYISEPLWNSKFLGE